MAEKFKYLPNWATPVQVKLSYKTDIFTSRSGKEQRRALRTTPRKTLDYTIMLHRSEWQVFAATMSQMQNAEFYFADPTRQVAHTGITAGAMVLRQIAPDWLVTGAKVAVLDGTDMYVYTVDTATGAAITFTTTPTWSREVIVRPCLTGQLNQSLSGNAHTSTTVSMQISYDVAPTSEAYVSDTFNPYILAGKEVATFPWNWKDDISLTFNWPIEQVDYGRGKIANHRIIDFGTHIQQANIIRQGREIDYYVDFLKRQKGQRGEFWLPSGMSDLTIEGDTEGSGTTFTSNAFTAFNSFYQSGSVNRGIAIYLTGGRKIFRRINSVAKVDNNSVITVNRILPYSFTADEVIRISWLRVARLSGDDTTLEYLTDNVMQHQLSVQSLPYATDDLEYDDLDNAAQWFMDDWGDATPDFFDALNLLVNFASYPPLGA
jgi:hypothetical protein